VASILPAVLARLESGDHWIGLRRVEPQSEFSYLRLASRTELEFVGTEGFRFHVGLHSFVPQVERNALHDHRFPLEVYPFAAQEGPESLGVMTVLRDGVTQNWPLQSGMPYGLPARGVKHAIYPSSSFYSVVLSTVSASPTRPSRMREELLTGRQADTLRRRMRAALAQHLLTS
jgi:hypothetical protein